jgi:hypothetical protein
MARLFTQEDIDRMKAMNKDTTGVEVGTLMLPNEIEDLGYGAAEDPAPTMDPVTAPVVEAAQNAPAVVTNAAPLAAQDTSGAATLQQLLAPQAATPTDPYANLSKTQRRMLAFSALEDAGASLSGRQGGSFNAMLGRFNEQADMQRKATAAAQRNQLLGGGLASREAILGAAAQGLIDGPTAKLMIEELDRQKTQGTEISGKAALIARIDALMNDPNLEDALGFEGIVRGFASTVGLDPNVARVNEMIKQVRGDVFLQAFEKLKGGGQITELEGMKAEQAMARLGQMQSYEDYVNSLKELRFYVDIFSRRLQGESIPDEMIYTPGQGPQGGSTDPLSDEDLDNLYPPSTPTN